MSFLINPYVFLPSGPLPDNILFGGDQATGRLLLSGDQQAGTDLILHRSDPDFASVTLLVEPDGPDGAITFSDLSTTGHTLTRVGTSVQDAVIKKYGIASMDFTAGTDYLNCGASTEHNFGSGDFTVECWVRRATEPGSNPTDWLAKWESTASGRQWLLEYDNASNTVELWTSTDGSAALAASFDLDTDGIGVAGFYNSEFHHIAGVRDGATVSIYVDGILGGTTVNRGATPLFANGQDTLVGARRVGAGSGFHSNAHIAGVRITKGVARYTAPFTPPAFQFNRS